MESSIKIDFADVLGDGIKPVITVVIKSTDDPRDKLLQTLFQSTDSYLKVQYAGVEPSGKILYLLPCKDVDIKPVFSIMDNSHAFKDWLYNYQITHTEISFSAGDHGVVVYAESTNDIFNFGMEWGAFKARHKS